MEIFYDDFNGKGREVEKIQENKFLVCVYDEYHED